MTHSTSLRVMVSKGRTMNLADRGLKPVAVLAAGRGHGDRLRYLAGCKCVECRAANARYENMRSKARRSGDWNGLVPASTARRHLIWLSRRGLGRRAVAAASDVGETTLCDIRSRKKRQIRARTGRAILAVTLDMASDHALTSARRAWKMIHRLVQEGYTKQRIARELGYVGPGLQFRKERMTVRNVFRVGQVYRCLTE